MPAPPIRTPGHLLTVAAATVLLSLAAACTKEPEAKQPASRPAETTAATTPATATAPTLDPAQRAALERMLAAVQTTFQELRNLESIRPRTPEFLQLKLATLRQRLNVQLLLYRQSPQRTAALQDYLTAAQQTDADIKARQDIDATTATLASAAYALAEAEYLAANDGALPPARTPEQQAIAQRMSLAAARALQGILDLENIRPRTPEFLQLHLEACRRLCDADLLLNPSGAPRQTIVDRYLAQARECYAGNYSRRDIDATQASIAIADYAVADAELLAAAPAAPADVVAHHLAAAQRANEGLIMLQDIRPRTPEFADLRRICMKRLLQAKLLAHPLPADRRSDLEAYAADIKRITASIKQRSQIDAAPATISLAEFADAEADYWLAGGNVE